MIIWRDDDALFDYTLWNYYDFRSLRTNNHLEGWHHRLNNVVTYIHIFIYLFVQLKTITLITEQYYHVI